MKEKSGLNFIHCQKPHCVVCLSGNCGQIKPFKASVEEKLRIYGTFKTPELSCPECVVDQGDRVECGEYLKKSSPV